MELNFETLTKILSKESNKMLDDFIVHIFCSCLGYSIIDIVHEIDRLNGDKYHELITSLSKDLKDYGLSYNGDDLTDEGYDFLILYVQYRIISNHRKDCNLAVFGQESGTINF